MSNKKPDKTDSVALPISVSPVLYRYLSYLVEHTLLGQKETDVARYLLTQRLETMVRDREHERLMPPQDENGTG